MRRAPGRAQRASIADGGRAGAQTSHTPRALRYALLVDDRPPSSEPRESDLDRVPLAELLTQLFAAQRALSPEDLSVLRARPDLASAADRAALLERAVSSDPQGTLRVADERLVTWLVESVTRDRFQKARPSLQRLWASRGAPALSALARKGLEKMGDRTARQAKQLDEARAAGALRWDAHHPSPLAAAVAGQFELAPETAFDRVGHLLSRESAATETGAQLAKDVLFYLAYHAAESSGEPRWVESLRALQSDRRLAISVRQALAAFEAVREPRG